MTVVNTPTEIIDLFDEWRDTDPLDGHSTAAFILMNDFNDFLARKGVIKRYKTTEKEICNLFELRGHYVTKPELLFGHRFRDIFPSAA